mgnify:CR=1 FL=1
MQLGISLYTSVDKALTVHTMDKAKEKGMHIAFSSLQIPEEQHLDVLERFHSLQQYAVSSDIRIFTDISRQTVHTLHLQSVRDLRQYGVEYIRLDDGFTSEEMKELSKVFHIVVNASASEDTLKEILEQCDSTRICACHNYYPEPYTGLSLEYVQERNVFFHQYGIQTIGFIPGNHHLRGPLYEGLPTVESHRWNKDGIVKNVLELCNAGTDIVLIGDIDVQDSDWDVLGDLQQDFLKVPVHCTQSFDPYMSIVHHDRKDYSEWMFRSVESRQLQIEQIVPFHTVERVRGSICINNQTFGRYAGELSIAKKDMPADERVNVVGHISLEYMQLIDLIDSATGIQMIEAEKDES